MHKPIIFYTSLLMTSLLYADNTTSINNNYDKSNSTYASLFPIQKASLSSPMTGVIQKINFRPGDQFKQGDVLVQFDCEEVDLKSKRAQAELDAASAQLDSTTELMRLNSASKIELAKAKSQFEIAKADLNIMKFQQKQCQVLAPYHGEVVHQSAEENETVKTDDPLIDIIDNRELEIKMYIPSIWLQHIKAQTPFTLVLDELPKQHFNATVTKIVGQIDPASQSILIYGKLVMPDTNEKLTPQMLFSGMSGIAYFNPDMHTSINKE
ncbi:MULTISPECIES: efflux RND transporter periplasmic adaptor subunit [Cysteiniphilum]|uniref:efflux RND transporter periplasmic adaptor subunit n=2 Tax=Fastidiosibacteraceae TaxID=2056687 RepID=UPI00178017B4|nr:MULTISPECIES: efflux RND transporter periplasmic adaptor subunit [Cysteiniphilum]